MGTPDPCCHTVSPLTCFHSQSSRSGRPDNLYRPVTGLPLPLGTCPKLALHRTSQSLRPTLPRLLLDPGSGPYTPSGSVTLRSPSDPVPRTLGPDYPRSESSRRAESTHQGLFGAPERHGVPGVFTSLDMFRWLRKVGPRPLFMGSMTGSSVRAGRRRSGCPGVKQSPDTRVD